MHGFRCYDNIAPNAKCQRVLVLGVCLGCDCFAVSTSLASLAVSSNDLFFAVAGDGDGRKFRESDGIGISQ